MIRFSNMYSPFLLVIILILTGFLPSCKSSKSNSKQTQNLPEYAIQNAFVSSVLNGHAAMLRNELQRAEKDFLEAIKLKPNHPEPYYRLSQTYYLNNRFQLALEQAQKLQELNYSNQYWYSIHYAQMLHLNGLQQKALQALTSLKSSYPNHLHLYCKIDTLLSQSQKHSDRIQLWNQFAPQTPSQSLAQYLALSHSYFKMEQKEKAIEYLDKASDFDKLNPEILAQVLAFLDPDHPFFNQILNEMCGVNHLKPGLLPYYIQFINALDPTQYLKQSWSLLAFLSQNTPSHSQHQWMAAFEKQYSSLSRLNKEYLHNTLQEISDTDLKKPLSEMPLILGHLHYLAQDYATALMYYKLVPKNDPNKSYLFYNQYAIGLMVQGEWGDLSQLIEEAMVLYPFNEVFIGHDLLGSSLSPQRLSVLQKYEPFLTTDQGKSLANLFQSLYESPSDFTIESHFPHNLSDQSMVLNAAMAMLFLTPSTSKQILNLLNDYREQPIYAYFETILYIKQNNLQAAQNLINQSQGLLESFPILCSLIHELTQAQITIPACIDIKNRPTLAPNLLNYFNEP